MPCGLGCHLSTRFISRQTKKPAAHAGDRLYDETLRLLSDETRQHDLQTRVRALARPQATEDIVDELLKLIEK